MSILSFVVSAICLLFLIGCALVGCFLLVEKITDMAEQRFLAWTRRHLYRPISQDHSRPSRQAR